MSELVAVVATPGSEPVTSSEVERLADEHDRLRGPLPRRLLGHERARAVVLGDGQDLDGTASEAPSWLASAGTIRPHRTWQRRHVEELGELDGHFALVSYDAVADQVLIANDPMGMCPLYVAEQAGRTYVATSAMVLARHLGASASRLGVQSFLLTGYQFGTRTNWDAVRRLDPATCIVVSRAGVREQRYWRCVPDEQVAALSLDDAVEHGLEVLRATCKEYLAGAQPCVDLTGGFDSRLLALVLESAGVSFCTNTRSVTRPDDMDIAREIAGRKQWEWHDLSLGSRWPLQVPDHLSTALVWGDAQLEVLQLARVLVPHQRLAAHRTHLLCSAGGEHFERNWESEFFRAGRSPGYSIDRWIDMIALKRGSGLVLSDDAAGAVRSDLRQRLLAWVEPYAAERNTTSLEMLHAYTSMGHGGAYRAADGGSLSTELPFYWKPVFTAAVSTDFRHRNGHGMHRGMIDALDPRVASVRTTHGGSAEPWRLTRPDPQLRYQAAVARKVFDKLVAPVVRPTAAPGVRSFPWQAAAHGAVLRELAGQGLLRVDDLRIGPLLRRDRFEALVDGAVLPGFAGSAVLGRLITAEMALRATDTALA